MPRLRRSEKCKQLLAELVFWFRGDARGVAKEFHEAVALGFSGTLFEEVSSCFNNTNFFRHGGSDPLVQGDTVLFGEALGGLASLMTSRTLLSYSFFLKSEPPSYFLRRASSSSIRAIRWTGHRKDVARRRRNISGSRTQPRCAALASTASVPN